MTLANTKRKPTLADIAKLAGVSKTAVSAAMHKGNGKTIRVGEDTAKLIHEAAKRLGYRANSSARSLATGKTGFIGFMLSSTVSHGFLNPYFAGFLQGAEAECRSLGYGLAVSCAPFSEAGRFINSNILSQRRIDGLIVAGEMDSRVYSELNSFDIPFIVVNALPMNGIPTLSAAQHADVVRLAISKGHSRILMTRNLNAEKENKDIQAKMEREFGSSLKIEFALPEKGEHPNWEPGFGLGRHLFKLWSAKPPEERATFVFSNGVLPEFHAELLKAGFKCPDDVSLLGDNSFDFSVSQVPAFARLRVDHEAIGADAVELLRAAIESGEPVKPEACALKRYPASFVEGETLKEMRK